MVIRLGLSIIVGVFVTLALFYLMQALIAGADSALTDDKIGNLVDFVRVKQDAEVNVKDRKPKKPPPPDEPPPETPPDIPFHVERTVSDGQALPVYTDYKNGRTKIVTVLRRCSGDIDLLREEMEKVVESSVETTKNLGRKRLERVL